MTMIIKTSIFLCALVFTPVVAHSQVTGQVDGGGWIAGANGGKANFGVDLGADGTDARAAERR